MEPAQQDPKSAKKVKAPKETKPKKEKAPKEPQVVFAFRLTEAQRDQIHKAAGPGKATDLSGLPPGAASADAKTFEGLVEQPRAI